MRSHSTNTLRARSLAVRLALMAGLMLVASTSNSIAGVNGRFDFNTMPLTTATVGVNGTSISSAAQTNGTGLYMTTSGTNVGVDLIAPAAIVAFPSLAVTVEYARNEASCDFFSCNGTRFFINNGVLSFTYRYVQGGTNKTGTITCPAPAVTTSGNFSLLTATYNSATGVAQILVNGIVQATATDKAGRELYWTGATTMTIGALMDGGTPGFVTLGSITFADDATITVLPVELTSFSAMLRNDAVQLRWNTATEKNNYGFEIERSTDNATWTVIGFEAGAGTTSAARSYTHTDHLDASVRDARTISYRLRQIDRDGTSEYSAVVSISNSAASVKLSNHPNPFNPSTTISFSLARTQSVTLTVTDATGREVARLIDGTTFDAGTHSVAFMADALPSGVYFYHLAGGDGVSTGRMLLSK